jgi:hypothetical protein
MGQYKPMPKMKTTEPSVELKLKKGGKVESMREIEAHERNEQDEIGRVKKELKMHEKMKASKAHKGLKMGGLAPKAGPNVIGGLAGGISATRPDKKGMTGGLELSKYKKGGLAAKGMATARKYETKINDASKVKAVKGGTGGIEGSKFKRGGAVAAKGMAIANKYQTKINDASSPKKVKGGTGGLEGSKYKAGGHVAMSCKAEGGYTTMKKMQKC